MNLYFKPKLGSKRYFSTKRNEDVLSNTLHIEDLEELATNGTSSNNTDSDEFRCAHLPWHSVKKWAHFRSWIVILLDGKSPSNFKTSMGINAYIYCIQYQKLRATDLPELSQFLIEKSKYTVWFLSAGEFVSRSANKSLYTENVLLFEAELWYF